MSETTVIKKDSRFTKITQWVAVLTLLIIIVTPLIMVILRSFSIEGDWQFSAPIELIAQSNLGSVYINSLFLGVLVVLGSTLLALPLAFLMTKTDFKRHKWLDTLLIVPFMTPPYIASMGWMLFMQRRGILESVFPSVEWLQRSFFSVYGIAMIMSFNLFPFLYLILKNALVKINSSIEEAGAVHGGSFQYRLKRIIFPLMISPLAMGALLVFVKTISEFGTPATLGRQIGYFVLTTEIYQYTSSWPIDFGRAAAISSVLLVTSMTIWFVQTWINSRYTWQTLGSKSKQTKEYALGRWRYLVWLYVGAVLLLAIGVPYFSMIATSLMDTRGAGLALGNVTFRHFQAVLSPGSQGYRGIVTSIQLALSAATLAALLGTFYALTVVKSKGRIKGFIDSSSLISNTIPAVVVIVGLIFFWNHPNNPLAVYNTSAMVVFAYVVLFLPFTVQYVKSSAQQIDSSLYQAARVGGASRWFIFKKITLPLIWSGIVAGWIMTFIISTRELIASLMIRPPGMVTTATYIFGQFEQGNASQGMAMALITVTLTVVVMVTVQRMQKGARRFE